MEEGKDKGSTRGVKEEGRKRKRTEQLEGGEDKDASIDEAIGRVKGMIDGETVGRKRRALMERVAKEALGGVHAILTGDFDPEGVELSMGFGKNLEECDRLRYKKRRRFVHWYMKRDQVKVTRNDPSLRYPEEEWDDGDDGDDEGEEQ